MIKTVIRFGAPWCGPCRTYAKIFHTVSEKPEFSGIKFSEIDIDDEENEHYVDEYKIMGVPTTIILDENGNVIDKKQGLLMENVLTAWLNGLIGE